MTLKPFKRIAIFLLLLVLGITLTGIIFWARWRYEYGQWFQAIGEYGRGFFPVISDIVIITALSIIFFVLGYGIWLSLKVTKIMNAIESISMRNYQAILESGMFREIYTALNKMDMDIKESDKLREDTEHTRNEWIVNITHDLKTPLSPIKGYAELLTSQCKEENATEYGQIILRNALHTEKLINDLKLTYQLDSGAIPLNIQKVMLSRYIKELVIDIVNDPAFSNRNIKFKNNCPDLDVNLDTGMFRRAFQNIVINALVHNPQETEIEIEINNTQQDFICIYIRDNGVGMTEPEQTQLFKRYYRGTSTNERPEGSGLGLAIAKQIVELHAGKISVSSNPDKGTEFIISIPHN